MYEQANDASKQHHGLFAAAAGASAYFARDAAVRVLLHNANKEFSLYKNLLDYWAGPKSKHIDPLGRVACALVVSNLVFD